MTKSESKEVSKTLQYGAALGHDYVARALSALIRAASKKSQRDILALVPDDARASPDFIV
jgi:hypothetical protein